MDISEVAAHVSSLRDLDKLVIIDRRGKPSVRIGWVAALFFAQGETLEKRLLANSVLRDFLSTFGERITHYHPADAERLKKIGDTDIAAYSDADARETTARSGRNANDAYGADIYGFEGGVEVMQPAPFYLEIAGSCRERPTASDIVANFPLTWPPADDLAPLIDLFLRWCGIIKPIHGTVSPGIILTQGGGPTSSDFVSAYPLIQRFPGLDYVDASHWVNESRRDQRKIRTIGWLTALDDGLVAALGGAGRLGQELPPDVIVHAFAGGVVLQAGPRPRLGDRNRADVPAPYRAVARLLRPLVFNAYPRGLFHPIAPLDPKQETRKWLDRFE
jgi:hypothetical protein